MWQKIKSLFKKQLGGGLLPPEQHDARDYELGWSPFGGSYKPKNVSVDNGRHLVYRNQQGLNVCVVCSGNDQKENDEGVILDDEDMASYLRSKGQINPVGASISSYQNALRDRGVAERGETPTNYNQSFESFTLPGKMKIRVEEHKTLSFYKTSSLDKVLEELDNGRTGQTGMTWFSAYNRPNNLGIITPQSGNPPAYHAITIEGYNTSHYGFKVLKVHNSFGEQWGVNGDFFVRFDDFDKIFGQFGVYFQTDLPKDKLKFLSMYEGKVVKTKGNKACYLITGGKKRGFPDPGMLMLWGFSWASLNYVEKEMLDMVEEGPLLTMEELPPEKRENFRLVLKTSLDDEEMKKYFYKYFPEVYDKN